MTSGRLSFEMPAFSPDGQTIFALGVHDTGELVRLDSASGRLVPYLDGLSATWLSYSPDRESIAYVSHPQRTLWRSRLDGSDRRQLTTGPFEVDGAAWSPDGRWIAFRSRLGGTHMKIYLIPADGGVPHALIPEDRELGIASWSPDSRRLVFGDVPPVFGRADGDERLHTYDLATRRFVDVPGSDGLWTARWSPDGRSLSALTIATQQLRIFDWARGSWRAVGTDAINSPGWSHDSRFVYDDSLGVDSALKRVRTADGQVAHLFDLWRVPMLAYWWAGLTPDDSPLVLRNLGPAEVYALKLGQ